jgi:EAL domain-containing protein (putative c-di-GMP-specific phosphodiesterase class I)
VRAERIAQQWEAWRSSGFCTIVSVNLSARVLMDKGFVADVRRILHAHGVPGGMSISR